MLIYKPLESISYVCHLAIFNEFGLCDADQNFKELATHQRMIIIVFTFLYFIICGLEKCVGDGLIKSLIKDSSSFQKATEGYHSQIRILAFISSYTKDLLHLWENIFVYLL